MNIAAILDLDKAIETFKNKIQTLLLVGDLSDWDGTILLSSLSQEPLAEQEANKRTQESRGFGSQSQGEKQVKIKTLGNVEVSLSVNYVLTRRSKKATGRKKKSVKPGKRGKAMGQGFCPLLRWLGMEERVSPMVWSTVAMFGMMSSSFATACKQLQEWGISLSEQRIPALLKRLGLESEQIIEVIDFYHATEKLSEFSELVFSNKKQAKEWFEKARSNMKNKSSCEVIKEMQKLANDISNKKRKAAAESALPYFVDQPQRFGYREVQAMKLPIGSGAIESLIRQVVNMRLKGNGKFWLPENAELILHGRCQWAAGQWQQFSQNVLTSGITPKLLPVATFDDPTAEAA
jgi:hypothetical protein